MSVELWKKLPDGFLKRGLQGWRKLDRDVQELIVELAAMQKFNCALCKDENRDLEVEHEHEPREKVPPTIYNIRGLVCGRCNRQLMFYEKAERGEAIMLGDNIILSRITSDEYEDYKDGYRVRASYEEVLKKKMGYRYWDRRRKLDFIYARYEDGRFPWQQDHKWLIRAKLKNPEYAAKVVVECIKFASEQFEKDPNFQPPDGFWKMINHIRPIIDSIRQERTKGQLSSAG